MCEYRDLSGVMNRKGAITSPTIYAVRDLVLNAAVSCRNGTAQDADPAVCPWTGKLSDWMEMHKNKNCPYDVVACPFVGCRHHGRRKDSALHLKCCPDRIVPCGNPHCDFTCKSKNLDMHLKHCPYRMVTCPNPGCFHLFEQKLLKKRDEEDDSLGGDLRRFYARCYLRFAMEELDEHVKDCPFRSVECPHVGCRFCCANKNLDKHTKECPFRIVQCPRVGCRFCCAKKDLMKHCKAKHLSTGALFCTVSFSFFLFLYFWLWQGENLFGQDL